MITNVFVTGVPGVGKTTLIQRVLADLEVAAGGFYTAEIREDGRRVGFSIQDLRGPGGVLAHVDLRSGFTVGRYGVNREDLERIGVPAVAAALASSPLVVLDELGRMELCSEPFRSIVIRALDSPTPVLGTLQKSRNAFLDSIRARTDIDLHELTERNRDGLRVVIRERVSLILHGR